MNERKDIWKKGNLIGSGSFGDIYKCYNGKGEFCAVKEIRYEEFDKTIYENFKKEVQLMKCLSHPNIISFIGCNKSEHSYQLFIEYASEGSIRSVLDNLMKVNEKMSEELCSNYLFQTINGLSYLHSKHIVHRDLKCSNLLLTVDGIVKISDFGSSINDMKPITCAKFQGSLFWAAPEVIKCKTDIRYDLADIWSIGCVLIEMLTMYPPYYNIKTREMLGVYITQSKEVEFDHSGISDLALDLIYKCCCVDPHKRIGIKELLKHPFIYNSDNLLNKHPHLLPNSHNNNNRNNPLESLSKMNEIYGETLYTDDYLLPEINKKLLLDGSCGVASEKKSESNLVINSTLNDINSLDLDSLNSNKVSNNMYKRPDVDMLNLSKLKSCSSNSVSVRNVGLTAEQMQFIYANKKIEKEENATTNSKTKTLSKKSSNKPRSRSLSPSNISYNNNIDNDKNGEINKAKLPHTADPQPHKLLQKQKEKEEKDKEKRETEKKEREKKEKEKLKLKLKQQQQQQQQQQQVKYALPKHNNDICYYNNRSKIMPEEIIVCPSPAPTPPPPLVMQSNTTTTNTTTTATNSNEKKKITLLPKCLRSKKKIDKEKEKLEQTTNNTKKQTTTFFPHLNNTIIKTKDKKSFFSSDKSKKKKFEQQLQQQQQAEEIKRNLQRIKERKKEEDRKKLVEDDYDLDSEGSTFYNSVSSSGTNANTADFHTCATEAYPDKCICRVLYNYKSLNKGDVDLSERELVLVIKQVNGKKLENYWYCYRMNGEQGYIPKNYVMDYREINSNVEKWWNEAVKNYRVNNKIDNTEEHVNKNLVGLNEIN